MTQIVGGHNFGLADGSFNVLARNDPTNAGSLADGVAAYVNTGNGNLVYQERDAYLPSLGADFELVRSYNARGVIGSADGWSYSTAVTLASHNDSLANGGTQRNYTVTYGDRSSLHFDHDAASNTWISTDAAGAYEVLTELTGTQSDGAAFQVVRGDQSRYRFDKGGALLSIADPNGVKATFTYQGGKLRTVKDDTGHTITFEVQGNALTRVTKTSATDGAVTTLAQYGYSGSQLTSVTDRMSHVTRYTYSSDGMLIGVALPAQQLVGGATQTFEQRNLAFTYQRIEWDDHPHLLTDFDKGFSNVITSMTDAMGGVTNFDYGFKFGTTLAPGDRDLAYKQPGGRSFLGGTTRVVDSLGNARAYSNATEYVAWRTANGYYATYGTTAPQAQVDAIRNAQAVVYTYDANSQITQVVDQQGFKTSYAYDAKGNLASLTERNGHAAITRDDQVAGDGYYRKLRVELGFADQPLSFFTAQPNWSTVQAQILARFTTRFAYDARGNQIAATDGSGNKTSFTYTGFNKVASITSAVGNALAELDTPAAQARRVELGYPGPLASLSSAQMTALRTLHTTTFVYDGKQNLTQRTDAGGDVTTFVYNANGDVTTRTVVVPAVGANPAQNQVTTYGYDAYGNAITIRDAEGLLTTQTFDSFGNLLTSVDPRGGVTRFAYDKDNRLLTTQTPEGRVTANAYDAVGNRIAITDFAGKTTTQVFDRNNMLVATIDPSPSNPAATRNTTFQYDILGNRTRSTDAEGRVTTYRYDSRRLMLDVTTPQVLKADGSTGAYVSRFGYDGEGNVITATDNNGATTQTAYDNLGLTRRITDALGNITEYTHDANLKQVQVVVGMQLATAQRRVLRFAYDEEDQLVATTDALGGKRRTGYDAAGNIVAVTDENGNTTQFQFDRDNRLLKETRPGGATSVLHAWDANGNEVQTTDENGHVTRYAFDKDDRRVMVTDANGINTVYEYDSRNNTTKIAIGVAATYDAATAKVTIGNATLGQVETFGYDEFNQLVSHTDGVGNALANSDSAVAQAMRTALGKSATIAGLSAADKTALQAQYTERYGYDRVGNRLTEVDHLGRVTTYAYDTLDRQVSRTDATGTALQRSIAFRYDGEGNRVRSVDAQGRVASYRFDAGDRIVETTDALGVVTRFGYDNVGNKTSETLAAGTPDERVTSWVYDLNDRATSETDAGGHARSYEYDAVGNRLRMTDARGGQTQYVYDAQNRNIRIVDPLGLATAMTYDGVGNTLSITDPKGGVRTLQYDAGDRQLQTTDAEGRVTRYAYDVLGNAVGITTAFGLPEAETSSFVYDVEGNLRSATDAAGKVSTSGYDAAYNRTRVVDANGHVTTTEFDALNRQIKVVDPLGGQTLYRYDAVDNVLTETDPAGRVRSFAYDAGDRQITQTDALGVQTTYAYDRVGNQVGITQAANVAGEERTTQFFFDKDDQLIRQVDALLGETLYVRDANGNVTEVTDANGKATRYEYDADDRVTKIIDPLGAVTQYGYDANGNRNQVIDANGGRTTFYFNRNNEIERTISALGFVTTRAYDGNGNLTQQTRFATAVAVPTDASLPAPAVVANVADRTTEYGYDKLNRMVSQTSALRAVQRTEYDAVGNKTAETDANEHKTRYEYDANDRLVKRTDALGGVRTSTYDAVGNRLSETDELLRVTHATFDLENRQLTSTDPNGNVRSFSYDAVGNKLSDTDELGRRTGFAYDRNDRLVRQTNAAGGFKTHTYDAVGNRTSTRDENGHVTGYAYDADNRLTVQTDALGKIRRYAYDALGNQTAETDENGHIRRSSYDLDNRLVGETDALGKTRSYAYDAVGNQMSATDERGNTTRFGYDADNRQTSRTDSLGAVRTFAYDAAGNKTAETDENGHTTSYSHDVLDRLVRQTNPLGADNVKTFAYDAVGNQTRETDENGHATNFAYDLLDRLVSRTDTLGGSTSYTYDDVGNRLTETDQRGKTTSFVYDVLDRIVKQTDALGGERSFSYDAVGNRTAERNEIGRTTTYTYDANDRVTSEVDPLGHSRTLTYDDAGNVLTQTDENGNAVSFTYDANDRVTKRQDPIGSTSYGYDAKGNKTSETDPNGNTTSYAYDANDRLGTKTDPLGGTYSYGYDAKGNKTSETDENGHGATYGYDANDRLAKITDGEGYESTLDHDAAGNVIERKQELDLADPGRQAVTIERFDELNRLVATLTADGRLITYVRDAAGNVVRKTEHDHKYTAAAGGTVPAPDADDPGRVTLYAYDDLGRLTTETSPEGIVTSHTYDAASNRVNEVVADGSGNERDNRIGYDSANRVTSVTDALGIVTRFVLDSRGNVLEKHEADGTASARKSTYDYDTNNRVTKETDAAGIVTTFTYNAAGDMLSRVRAGRTERFEYDKNHRLAAEINGAGERTEYRYDAAGNRTQIRVGASGGSALRVLSFEYDESDHLTAEIDGAGVRTEHRYDGAGNRVETVQNAFGAAAEQHRTLFEYDRDNRLTKVTDAEGGVTSYVYDALGNQTEIVGPTGAVTRNTFDRNGRVLTNIVDAEGRLGGIKTVNTYDRHGNVVATTVSFGDGSDARTTRYAYDALDRQTSVTDAEGFTTDFSHDAFGNQTRIRTGQYLLAPTDAGYDAAKAARAHKSELVFSYDKLDRLTDTKQITDNASGAGDTLHSTYDAFGNRLTQTTGFGADGARTLTFAYDAADRLVRRVTAEGGVLTLAYDAAGNQTAKLQLQRGTEGAADAVWTQQYFEYDGNGRLVAERNVLDATTTVRSEHRFDAFGNEVETVIAKGTADERTARFEFNRNGDMTATVMAAGTPEARRTDYGIDAAGNTVSETDALGRTTRFYFDGAGRQTGTLDAGGYYTRFSHDSQGNVGRSDVYMARFVDATPGQYDAAPPQPAELDDVRTVVNTYDRVNNLVQQVLADGNRMTYEYDANRKLIVQTNHGSPDAARVALTADSTPLALRFAYDDALRLKTFVNADGSVESYAYDSANNQISESIGNPSSLPGGRTDPVRTTTFRYDGDNRLIEQAFDPAGLNQVDKLAYDKAGNVLTKTDARGGATVSTYDRFNRLVSVTDPVGATTTFGYDLVGNRTSIVNALGNTTSLSYDHLDQLVEQRLAAVDVFTIDGGLVADVRPTTALRYDAVGNVVQEIDENGARTTRWFDANDNVIAELDGDNALRTATFDANGSALAATLYMTRLAASAHDPAVFPSLPTGSGNDVSRTTTFEYDSGNRIVRAVLPETTITTLASTATGSNPTSSEATVALDKLLRYDRFGNLVSSVDQAGRDSFGWYDALGRQVAAVDAAGYLTESSFDDQGNVVQQRKYATPLVLADIGAATRPEPPSGDVAVIDRIYDAANRLVEEISPAVQLTGGTERVRTGFTYDAAGNMTSRTLALGTTEAQTERYWYDAGNRQVAVVNASRTLHTFGYDTGGNQTRQSRYYNALASTLDLSTASAADLDAALVADSANDQHTTLAYDALNRLTSQSQNVAGTGYTAIALRTDYDAIGNATRKTDGDNHVSTVAYDALGHAVRTVTPDGNTSFVEYNAAGEKVRAWTGVLGANGALAASAVSASIGSALNIAWQQGGSGLTSFVVYDTASHADASFASGFPADAYSKTSGTAGTGAVSVGLPLEQFAAGTRVYFRVVSEDSAGSQAWTGERSVVVPARVTDLSTRDSGANLVFTATFNGAVGTPQLLYGSTSDVPSTANFSNASGNTWTVTIPKAQAGYFAVRWNFDGASYTTAATAFNGTGVHTYDPATKAAQWTLPQPLTVLQTKPDQVILIDGVRLGNGSTFNGTLSFDPALTTNGTRSYDVLYGNAVATPHTATVRNEDAQSYTVSTSSTFDANGVETSRTRTFNWQHNYRTNVSATLDGTETATVSGTVRVAYRTAGSGTAFTGELALTKNGNTFSGNIAGLQPGSYDLKIFYTDTAGREVVVEWQRIGVAATTLPASTSQTDSTAPFDDFAGFSLPTASTVVTATRSFSDNSVRVLARETGGTLAKTGNAIAITPGAYAGPLATAGSPFTLGIAATTGTQGGERTSDGLLAQTYFTEIEYNALGVKIASNEDDGLWRRFGVDATGNKVVSRLYGSKAADVAGDAPIVSHAAFDARDLEIARFGPEVTLGDGTTARPVTRMRYDYDKRLVYQLDPAPGASARIFGFDAAGNRISETNAAGNLTQYAYDRLGHVVQVVDALGHTRRREYDGAGRLVVERDAGDQAVATNTYDAFGRVVSKTDAAGNVTRYAYDRRDRLVEVTDGAAQETTYAYDRRDNRTRTVDAAGQAQDTGYDAMSRVVSQSRSSAVVAGGAAAAQTETYAYDAFGNRTSETDAAGRTRYMRYGASGRLVQMSDEGQRVTDYAYDRFGRPTVETGSNGKSITRSYNDAGWLTRVVDNGSDTTKTQTTITYDIGGNRKTELVEHTAVAVETARDIVYTHDGMGRITRWADSVTGLDLNYVWDAAGNQTRVYSDDLTTDHNYTYDANDRVTSAGNEATIAASYTYDAAGRRSTQTASGTTLTYSYDALNRVTKATDGAAKTRATWSYDALGNVLDYREFKADGTTLLRSETNTYFENGLAKTTLSELTEDVGDEKKKKQSIGNEYDASKRLVKQTLVDNTDPDNATTTTYTFSYTADGRTTAVAASSTTEASGSSSSTYDVNDRLIRLDKGTSDGAERAETLSFRFDNDGHIVYRFHDDGEDDTATSPTTRFVYAAGEPVGETGSDTAGGTVTLLDENGTSGDKQEMQYNAIQAIDKDNPASSTSTYSVRAGDNLQSVAAAVYGNPSLWFLIADANGLTGSEALKVGQQLQIPTSIEAGRLNADSHVLYKESDIIGSKLPNLKSPDSSDNTCALIGAIILLIVVAILAIIITVVTAGIAAPAAIAALGLTAGSLGAVIVTVAVGAVIGAVVAAAASAISQGILIGFGLQKEFDWKQFAADIVVGFISGGVSGLGQALQLVKIASTVAKVANVAAQAALEAAGETARQAIANDGHIDNPWTIIAAGAGGAFGAIASRAVRVESQIGRRLGGVFEPKLVELAPAAGKAGKLLGKSQKVIVGGINKVELAKFGDGASVFKNASTKLVKTVDAAGEPALREVERTAFSSKTPKTILKLKDTKLVRMGDDVTEVPRISSQFSRLQRVGKNLSGFAGSAASAVRSIPGAVAGAARGAATGVANAATGTVAALKALPSQVGAAADTTKFVARLLAHTVATGVSNFVSSAATAVRAVSRSVAELPSRIAKTASDAWSAGRSALKAVRDGLTGLAASAAKAVKALPGKIRTGVGDLATSFSEWRKSGTVAKGQITKTVRSFEDGPAGRIETFTQVARESYLKKGYKVLAKDNGVNGLPPGTKLVRVGDDVQTWRRVSSQYTVGQRINRYLAKTSVLDKVTGDDFKIDKTISKFTSTKIVRTGFQRQFNQVTQSFEEVATYATRRRLAVDGLDKTTKLVQGIKAAKDAAVAALSSAASTALEAVRKVGSGIASGVSSAVGKIGDKVSDGLLALRTYVANDLGDKVRMTAMKTGDSILTALPFSKAKMIQLGVGIAATVVKASLRDYQDDRAGGVVTPLIFIGKNLALTAFKQPRADLNNWLLNQSVSGIGKDNENANLAIRGVRSALYGLEKKHGWWPFDWIATGANVVSRVQSPIDLDYNATREQQLRSSQMTAGQTASFNPRSVFEFQADLDGRIVDRTMPLAFLNHQPPAPAMGLSG